MRATQSLASRVTKWSCDCDIGLHRSVAYINSTLHITMSGFIGDSINDCQLWLFCDSDFAGEFDAKSTTGCALFLVGPNTHYPLNAFSKKQTSITISSTESEVVAANQGIRAQGLPSLSLWFFLWMGEAGREAVPKAAIQPGTAVARIDPELMRYAMVLNLRMAGVLLISMVCMCPFPPSSRSGLWKTTKQLSQYTSHRIIQHHAAT